MNQVLDIVQRSLLLQLLEPTSRELSRSFSSEYTYTIIVAEVLMNFSATIIIFQYFEPFWATVAYKIHVFSAT